MVSRMPPPSPAAIMLVNSGSNVFGCRFMASASDAPLSPSPRGARMRAGKFLSSSWEPRISRHCTSGRPASIITENWRVNTARFFAETFLPNLPAFLAGSALTLAGLMRVTRICSRRSAETARSIVSAMRSPLTVWPPRVRPEYAKLGINPSHSSCCSFVRALRPTRYRPGGGDRPGARQSGAGDNPGAAVDHVLQFVPERRRTERRLERDRLLHVERRERLIRGLHPELFLARLHRAVDLVHLVVADQITDRRRRDHDLERHDPPRAIRARQQRLTGDALQDERQLGSDLRLLVRRKNVDDAVDGLRR